ncbi:hypothetical protein O181_027142 [Austropuccinia psidii MF-1]|uniref:6-phosphofructo-2-kinase domain-containing protein n=1 Tax=Austropuccinia psidii MF-1 TaxID=1389203 RepID=A0A9Q3CS13_9BASI|nr:hypothetical protein [Austropuccinia psidii MF-1]
MAAPLYTTASGRLWHAGLVLICVVGLPARGKTHVARSIDRYLRWLGVKAQVFSLGDHRRKVMGDPHNLPPDYFATDGTQTESTKILRESIKRSLLGLIDEFFCHGGQVAIYDANNGSKLGRQALRQEFEANGVHVMFIENVCDREDIIEKNIKAVKISSPDYKDWDPELATADYWRRVRDHEKTYEPIEKPSFPFVKVVNVGEKIIVNNISGYLQSRIVFYLMQIHNTYRTIWFARSGPSRIEHLYKADSELSPLGAEYAERLCRFLRHQRRTMRREGEKENRLTVWTSTRRRCIQTSAPMARAGYKVLMRSQMNEINPGVIDGMSTTEIKEKYPDEYKKSLTEPYAHRYPRAESYHDLSVRLEPIIFEVERDRSDLFIIGHASVIRCLFAYLKGLPPHDIPLISIRRGQLVEVTPTSYGVEARTHTFWTPSDNPLLYKFVSDEDAFHHVPESEQKAEELNKSIAPLAI